LVDHLAIGLLVDAVEFAALLFVDQGKKRRKGIAQVEAAAATVADVEYPVEFLVQRIGVVELRLLPAQSVARGRLEIALAA
jgi:hypothetical protein